MASTRLFHLAVACILPLSAVACGSSDGEGPIVPEGTHYGYVVNQASVPETNAQARTFGLDIGAAKSGTPDGTIDNRLGEVLATLAGMGFDIQGTIDEAINQGSIILLVDFQTADFMNTSAAGLAVKIGATPTPAPCTDPTDLTTCGQHLKGTGSFTISSSSPMDAAVGGQIVNGTFNGGPGDLSLQIALGTTEPLTLSLLAARARATGISETGMMTLTVGGALTNDDLNTQVLPAIQVQVAGVIERDCATAVPTSCTCTGATGMTLLNLFDGSDGTARDCKISTAEIAGNVLIKSLLAPDVCSTDTCDAPDALSLGIQVQTVKGTF
jgi:hypothetical protein